MQPRALQEPKTWIMQTLMFNLKIDLEYLKNAAQGAPGTQNLDHANPVCSIITCFGRPENASQGAPGAQNLDHANPVFNNYMLWLT